MKQQFEFNKQEFSSCDMKCIACITQRSDILTVYFQGCYVVGESRANGNGPTPNPSPPGSPKKTSRSSSPKPPSESGLYQCENSHN